VFVSTPKGRNWFYDLYTRGMDPSEQDYASFTFPSKASPYFPEKEWEEAKRTLPVDVFRQEYMAEFLEDSAGVFRGIDGCLVEPLINADEHSCSKTVVIGCDVAKHTDWTVLIAMDAETGRCFAMERFNQLDWPIQKERIVAFARKYRGRVILDATGVGDPIYDDLRRVLPDIEGYRLSASSKVALVQRLIVAVEQRRVSWPGTRSGASDQLSVNSGQWGQWEMLTAEMKRYEYAIGEGGRISYAAPSGYHDDCVMALALANHGRWESESAGSMARLLTASGRRGAVVSRRERQVVG